MAQIDVTDVSTSLGVNGNALVQNLGPPVLYVSTGLAAVDTGVQVPVGKAISFAASSGNLHGITTAAATCDVRVQTGASGIYSAAAA